MLNCAIHLTRELSTILKLFPDKPDCSYTQPFVLLCVVEGSSSLDYYVTNASVARQLAHALNQSADMLEQLEQERARESKSERERTAEGATNER